MQTPHSKLVIRVDDRHVITPDETLRLRLRRTDGSPLGYDLTRPTQADTDLGPLFTSGLTIDRLGLDVRRPDFSEAYGIVNRQFGVIVDLAKREPHRPFIATFGDAFYKAQWHPPLDGEAGQWTFAEPRDPRVEDEDSGYLTRRVDDLLATAWLGLERMLIIGGATMEYHETGNLLATMAKLLTADPQLIRTEVSQ